MPFYRDISNLNPSCFWSVETYLLIFPLWLPLVQLHKYSNGESFGDLMLLLSWYQLGLNRVGWCFIEIRKPISIWLYLPTAIGGGTVDFEGKSSFTSHVERKTLIQGSQTPVDMFLLSLAGTGQPQHEVYPCKGLLAKSRRLHNLRAGLCAKTALNF